jgi:hypothetical protein
MLINYFLRNPLIHKDVEKYQHRVLFYIAFYSIYSVHYIKDLTLINNILFFYLSTDLFFIPFNRIDSIIHHLLSISFIYYPTLFSIPLDKIIKHHIAFLKVETSSIFLCLSYYFKEQKKISNEKNIEYCSHISNVLLLSTFFKFRCYDFMYEIIKNPDFYKDMIIPNNTVSKLYIYTTVGSFFILNGFWFNKMINVLCKIIITH